MSDPAFCSVSLRHPPPPLEHHSVEPREPNAAVFEHGMAKLGAVKASCDVFKVRSRGVPPKRARRQDASGRRIGVNDGQPKDEFERIVIPIAMKQRMVVAQAERRDEAVDRLPNRVTAPAQPAKVAGRGHGEQGAARLEHLALQ